MTELQRFASPIGLSRDPHKEEAWVRKNKYHLPHPDDPSTELVAGRASELGKTISNTFTLNMWHQRQIVKGMALRNRLRLEAFTAMNDGLTLGQLRDTLQRIAKEAQSVADDKGATGLGIGFHKLTELVDAGLDGEVPEPWDRDIAAYAALLQRGGIVCVPEFTEKIIWNRSLNHCGKFDRLVRYLRHCDKWHAEDLKTGRTLDYGIAEIPVQLDVYAGADEIFDMDTEEWSHAPEICRDLGLVLHIPLGTGVATLYEVDLATTVQVPTAATPAELCVAVQRWQKESKGKWRAVARVEVDEAGTVTDAELTWVEQMRLASSDAELEEIRLRGKAAGTWSGWDTRRFRELTETVRAS